MVYHPHSHLFGHDAQKQVFLVVYPGIQRNGVHFYINTGQRVEGNALQQGDCVTQTDGGGQCHFFDEQRGSCYYGNPKSQAPIRQKASLARVNLILASTEFRRSLSQKNMSA